MLWRLTLTVAALGVSQASAETHTITMNGGVYAPAEITIRVGDELVFRNDDTGDHNVFVPTAGFAFDLGSQPAGEERRWTAGKAGRFDVECAIHQDMHLAVEVAP